VATQRCLPARRYPSTALAVFRCLSVAVFVCDNAVLHRIGSSWFLVWELFVRQLNADFWLNPELLVSAFLLLVIYPWSIPITLQADVMLPPLGKLRYSRWRPKWLPRYEICNLTQYPGSWVSYNFSKNVPHVSWRENVISYILIKVQQRPPAKLLLW